MTIRRQALFLACGAFCAIAGPARAHPHVWVKVQSTVVYERGSVAAIGHRWTFDEAYTVMAIEGLDKDKDGTYSREELAELAKINMEGLEEFAYFTHARLGDQKLAFKKPEDGWLEMTNGELSLNFTLRLEKPVLAEAEGLNFAVYDESFFIAFELPKETGVKLAAAPDGCAATVGTPDSDVAALKALSDSLGGAPTAGDANQGMGNDYAQTVMVGCKKS